jgi:hypothetical protein
VLVFGAPAVCSLSNASGFKLNGKATGKVNFDGLQARADNLVTKSNCGLAGKKSNEPSLTSLVSEYILTS